MAKGVLHATGVDGLYARSGRFENVIAGLDALISRFGADDPVEVIRFPPGMNRALFEKSGYMKSFPQLAGTVHSFEGGDRDHLALLDKIHNGEPWTSGQAATDIALTPAACYPLYPIAAERGPLPPEGLLFDLQSYCFRHEPSKDPGANANVPNAGIRAHGHAGSGHGVSARNGWPEAGNSRENSACRMTIDVANDPFFGRGGRVMASTSANFV